MSLLETGSPETWETLPVGEFWASCCLYFRKINVKSSFPAYSICSLWEPRLPPVLQAKSLLWFCLQRCQIKCGMDEHQVLSEQYFQRMNWDHVHVPWEVIWQSAHFHPCHISPGTAAKHGAGLHSDLGWNSPTSVWGTGRVLRVPKACEYHAWQLQWHQEDATAKQIWHLSKKPRIWVFMLGFS